MLHRARLLAPLLLGLSGPVPAAALCDMPTAQVPAVQPAPAPPRRCEGGRDTVAFGRLLVDYGVSTLRYGVGIVLIFLGLVVMALGYLLVLIDLLFCW
ncbi:hypothetical protein [Roseomonas sp. WA12]